MAIPDDDDRPNDPHENREVNGAIASTNQYYEEHAAEYAQRTLNADMATLRSRFLSTLPPRGRVLDAGCGSGRDLRVFVDRGFRASGIDASQSLVNIAQAFSGARCSVMRIEEMSFSAEFDGVWACASLLHLPRVVLPTAIARIHAALALGGVLFASVQEGNGEGIASDGRYFAYFSLSEFTDIVSGGNFEVESAWLTEDVLGRSDSQPRWINVLARQT